MTNHNARRRLAWLALGLAGIVFAAGVALATSVLAGQRIGLASQPLGAGQKLAVAPGRPPSPPPPPPRHSAPPRHPAVSSTTAATHTSTPAPRSPSVTNTTTTATVLAPPTAPASPPVTPTASSRRAPVHDDNRASQHRQADD